MDQKTLQQKLTALKAFENLAPNQIQKFGDILKEMDDLDLFLINPLQFATTHNLESLVAIDLFIHSTKIGLFDFAWNVICSLCGGIGHSYRSINDLKKSVYYCHLCEKNIPDELDNQIEVAFTLNPKVKQLHFDPYSNSENYQRYFFSKNVQHDPHFLQFLKDSIIRFYAFKPDESVSFQFEAEAGKKYRLFSVELHCGAAMDSLDQEPTPQSYEIDLIGAELSGLPETIKPGLVTLLINNLNKTMAGIILMGFDLAQVEQIKSDYPTKIIPFFTGKMLLNNQTFRDLFRIQALSEDLKLNIRSLTLLFTDLKGSTELYDQAGDVFAYNLIQEHFELLTESVRTHSGAIIKTMGDAIMASFSVPEDGILASIDMMQKMERLNKKSQGYDLGLKIGLHEGATLAVNSDERLDYFGQTVNIAARVQGLAEAGEIWVTSPIFQANGVQSQLSTLGYQDEEQQVSLKGVGQRTTVYRCHLS